MPPPGDFSALFFAEKSPAGGNKVQIALKFAAFESPQSRLTPCQLPLCPRGAFYCPAQISLLRLFLLCQVPSCGMVAVEAV